MKPRHPKSVGDNRRTAPAKNKIKRVDQLGIERGQNAEKGNTENPRNIRARDAKKAAH
jgi:hypothetical protein